MSENKKDINKKSNQYTIEDAIKVADDIFELSKEKKYKLGAFIHGLILALEYVEISYKIPQQQLALIKRESRRYFREMSNLKK